MGALCKNKHQERERKPRKRYSVLKRFLPSFVSPHTQLRFYFFFFCLQDFVVGFPGKTRQKITSRSQDIMLELEIYFNVLSCHLRIG